MSMMARFVSVAPNRLAEIKSSPDLIEDLFATDFQLPPFEVSPELKERVRSQAPLVLGTVLGRMPPGMRDEFMRQLGISSGDLGDPGIGDAILKRMAGGAPPGQSSARAGEPAKDAISLDKAWHGLHYLLCGAIDATASALGQAVLGGAEIGEDLGYGPARYFTIVETSKIAQALQAPDLEATMRARFDPAAMTPLGIYPGGWDEEGDDWLIDAFHALRDFYNAASTAGQAVITLIE
jgi:hypothetical protein